MELSVITVTLNDKENIAAQLRSVASGAEGLEFEQLVSDNGSTDGTIDMITKDFPQVTLVQNGYNAGFGAANNRAAQLTKGDFLLFLNPDMIVDVGSLKKMVEWMRARPEVGIASCKLLNPSGQFDERTKPRRLPTLFDQAMILLKIPHFFPSVLNKYLYAGFDMEKEQEVDSVRGSFLMMRRELYEKLGWAFDPRYYIWFEDVDVCREARKNGFQVVYTPIISCVDLVGQTFKKIPALWKQKNFTQSMLQYFCKWESRSKWTIIAILRPVAIFLTILLAK
ncbi:MAG: hypothetical protein COU29_03405 [Candidatus Magasanikbacteria bacterium CG10_big_fil_rev_8_21_14_0_10_36_32]|uniref:Glycosyltransferase 2-like domain-containing protein n=1 Tax=Candidatus Magasanikbacteria bacterium CG10_big_fil_rev_8_21_14_0_10_36_32 TaxID=1974646 RepID=A0A2M6W658_9BACT|nr:MAG: hypothetical protein COU29_03405 [Candidatus Magasanikbacteria bacterium CG10_big_fil_rev_8_21_14_0_10_36_32]